MFVPAAFVAVVAARVSAVAAVPGTRYNLLDGNSIPVIGLGVYMMQPGRETEDAVSEALKQGYRMVDTAAMYGNEHSVGKAVADSGIPREDLFIATKLMPNDHGYEKTKKAFENSRKKLDLQYVDLYIIHSPGGGKLVETWDAMLELQKAGLIRSIAVSNFGKEHLEALERHGRPMPVLNQIEMHPLQHNHPNRQAVLDYCKRNRILIQAYGSIFYGERRFLENEVFTQIAKAHSKSNAQVLLRWALQKGFQIIPKSTKKERIASNSDVFDFELSEAEMHTMSSIEVVDTSLYWNPLEDPVDLGNTQRNQASSEL